MSRMMRSAMLANTSMAIEKASRLVHSQTRSRQVQTERKAYSDPVARKQCGNQGQERSDIAAPETDFREPMRPSAGLSEAVRFY
jgi:hypothetical protein